MGFALSAAFCACSSALLDSLSACFGASAHAATPIRAAQTSFSRSLTESFSARKKDAGWRKQQGTLPVGRM